MDTLKNAGQSVRRRGFLEGEQAQAFGDAVLLAQVARLIEEAGEFMRSLRSDRGASLVELADVVIVAAAIAEHMKWDLDAAVTEKCYADETQRGYRHNGDSSPGGALTDIGKRADHA